MSEANVSSSLSHALSRLSVRAASAVVARGRIASPALNAALLRRLSAAPGTTDAFFADPVFEVASRWEPASETLDGLSGDLLQPELVGALDSATAGRIARDLHPYTHQLAAWRAAHKGLSCLVSSGTGSGKTECFMVPMLDDLLREPAKGRLLGVRAIVIYPLNALIESQRERLAAWTAPLARRLSFALYNGLTPETARSVPPGSLAPAEIGNRRTIRNSPPTILVTNVTMLEYLLLRAKDRSILEKSQGLLRWIVLDEAHSYIGAQAAEMALLLRRVRAAFGVEPGDVRLMATSATISAGPSTEDNLKQFVADLAGVGDEKVRVIEGHTIEPELPAVGPDATLDAGTLMSLDPSALWKMLATHPRIHRLKAAMSAGSVSLGQVERLLFGGDGSARRDDAYRILDAAAQALCPETALRLLPWRAHLFHRAQGGFWVCIDPSCPHRDPELAADDAGWGFGALHLRQRDHCDCGAPVFELVTCGECGAPVLRAGLEVGARPRLMPLKAETVDDFAIDVEPDEDVAIPICAQGTVWLAPPRGYETDRFVRLEDGRLFDNAPADGERNVVVALIEREEERGCCSGAAKAPLQVHSYGPPFLIGNALPDLVEELALPLDRPGLPMGGRRVLTFSDSRQGTARLAAKLQQEAERNLTRAFLYHAVQEHRGPEGEERTKVEKRLALLRTDPEEFAEEIAKDESVLAGEARPIPWSELINHFAQHNELRNFATEVWRPRMRGGGEMTEDPRKLAEMFLLRELFRRPKVQNNAETMGLVRLSFPMLEGKARAKVPDTLADAGVDGEGWLGLVLAAVDFVFRDRLAIHMAYDWMVPLVSPRSGWLKSICAPGLAPADRPVGSSPWPSPKPALNRASRVHQLVYGLIGGDWDNPIDQDRAGEVLRALWELIRASAARDVGGGAYRLDFDSAAVVRLDQGWFCPVTRRIYGYVVAGCSPYDIQQRMRPLDLPRLPEANAGGLTPQSRTALRRWCENEPAVATLRREGIWTNLHDRIAAYAPFLRAQEHSAQIERPVLADYERMFKEGRINVLNSSTTLEMGIDIPNVRLVVNANVPPSISNYRQRVGRAGRRDEPWAFAMTFCRDLPLDRMVFDEPASLLSAQTTAPTVRLDSPILVARHVNAALLAAFLRDHGGDFNVKASTGAFFGATGDVEAPVAAEAPADSFLEILASDWVTNDSLVEAMAHLTQGTVLDGHRAGDLAARCAEDFEDLLGRWRMEHAELLARAAAVSEEEVRQAFEMRARRMRGEFLLGELARRGFTPSYGFPVDVVTFDHLSGRRRTDKGSITFGEHRGGASRQLDVAIREYAPGAEVVIDGLVHRSEGILPAWGAMADASGLEDLQHFWECRSCRTFGLARIEPEVCPQCGASALKWVRALRPAGFLGRHAPHTGYEHLGHVPYEMSQVSAAGAPWLALPDPAAGRMRADSAGEVITLSSGSSGHGYAICLACGRAEAENEAGPGAPLPQSLSKHKPLALGRGVRKVQGWCPGGFTEPHRIQRQVRLVHAARTDVFELQLPEETGPAAALALAAGLREALSARLGAEAREIGVAVGRSRGPAGETRISAFLYDRATGGAGLVVRLEEGDWFKAVLEKAAERLNCREDCVHGCPACVLRPDLNFGDEEPDRPGGLELARNLQSRLVLPEALRVFGRATRRLDRQFKDWLERQRRAQNLSALTIYLHGDPSDPDWELAAWPIGDFLVRLAGEGVRALLVLPAETLTNKGLTMGQKLDLHRLAANSTLAFTSESLPQVAGHSIVATGVGAKDQWAVAASDPAEALPGPLWGAGATAPLLIGAPEAAAFPKAELFDSSQLIALSAGNAKLMEIGDRLNGSLQGFGKRFWTLLAREAPLAVTTINDRCIRAVEYSDRYLLTPLNIALLAEVLASLPSGGTPPTIRIKTAHAARRQQRTYAIFHAFPDDAMRSAVLSQVFPVAEIVTKPKKAIPHERRLSLILGDGQRLSLLLDQGFGAWMAVGTPRHDFQAVTERQVRAIRTLACKVTVEEGRTVPLVLCNPD